MPKSASRKLNSYQRSIKSHKKEIAALAEKKGVRFMAAAAMLLKGRKSASRKSRSRKSASRKSKSKSKHSCPKGKVWRKAHKSSSGSRVKGACVKKARKSRSKSRSRSQ
jgi:hypothetical protein